MAVIWRSGATLALLAGLIVAGCSSTPPAPPVQAPTVPPRADGPSKEQIRQRAIAYFLQRAEAAQQQGFLTQPAGGSAYDHYLRVLQLDPDNRLATSGIQSLVIDFVDRARSALRRRSFGEVNGYLSRAEDIAPNNPLVREVREQLVRERARSKVALPSGEAIVLPAGELASRSDAMKAQLKMLAERIRRESLRVIIVARNDAEGRWIYQQLREAVPGYRVRGDIRLAAKPQVILQSSGGA